MSIDNSGPALARRSLSGVATFYGGNTQGGHCSFSTYTIPSGLYGVASANWENSADCGGCIDVTYGGKTITAMIVDECPNCGTNHLDLFEDAFAELADKSLGEIDVTWDYVECSVITTPLQIHLKSGVSEYWFSAQVVNANLRTSTLEVSVDQGSTWLSTTRMAYNFFEIASGTGAATAWIKVTSVSGATVTVKDVDMTTEAVTTATANYV
ncbi:RlpA-like double-psi beta-barrel-protein domain-containing protein-containing protein [Delphinella strobiligena]|nr:RlpA-like double-psi beta-barrel-protein domain-containing protein-containing protein [Delphinella strobiligena]